MKKNFFVITASLAMTTICHAQANTKLSNLVAPTAVNANLIPGGGTGTKDIGSNNKRWRNGYFNATVYGYGVGSSYGVYGTSGTYGVRGVGGTYGVFGSGTYGTYGSGTSYGAVGIGGTYGTYGSGTSYGVYGTTSSGYGVAGISSSSYGLYGSSSSSWGSVAYGVYGAYGNGTTGYGVQGVSSSSYGVYGSSGYLGVYGVGTSYGVYGSSSTNYGVVGNGGTYGVYGSGTSYGVYGSSSATGGYFYSSSGNGIWANNNGGAVGSGLYGAVIQSNIYNYGGLYGPSDKNLKKNIADFGDAMSIINKLKPKNYEYRTDDNLASLNLPKGTHYGLIAQDLEEVLPNLVAKGPKIIDNTQQAMNPAADAKDPIRENQQASVTAATVKEGVSYKGVNYLELIPIMIKAMQELSKQNDDLKTQVATLTQTVSQFTKSNGAVSASSASINQNFPNPFTKSTVISFSVPQGSSANIIVSQTGSGKVIKTIPLSSGTSQLTFDGASLSAGSYSYSLYIDGRKIDTKQMIINR